MNGACGSRSRRIRGSCSSPTPCGPRWAPNNFERASAMAGELLDMANQFPGDWNRGNAVHRGHIALGHVALARGDTHAAVEHLLLAACTEGSPQLGSFGPDFELAGRLLARGDREPVVKYLELCERFWGPGARSAAPGKVGPRTGIAFGVGSPRYSERSGSFKPALPRRPNHSAGGSVVAVARTPRPDQTMSSAARRAGMSTDAAVSAGV